MLPEPQFPHPASDVNELAFVTHRGQGPVISGTLSAGYSKCYVWHVA